VRELPWYGGYEKEKLHPGKENDLRGEGTEEGKKSKRRKC